MKREWRTLLTLILLNLLAFAAVGYWVGILPRLRAVAALEAEAQSQIQSFADLVRRLPEESRSGVIGQIPPSLGTRVMLVRRDGTVLEDSAGEFAPGSRIQRTELGQVEEGHPTISLERLPSGSNALYAFAYLDDDRVLVQSRRAEGVTLTDTITLVSLFLLTSVAQSLAIYGLAGYRRNQENRQLAERLALAQQHEAFQREFIANAAHELRTPVWSIRLFADELVHDARAAELQTYVDPILRASDRLGALVSQLLDLSKMEGGMLELQYDWVEVQSWLESILRMLAPQAQVAGAELICQAEGAGQLRCDPHLMGQAVSNLVENALKYGGAGVKVTLSAVRVDGGLQIAVADTGPGIPPEHLPHVFDRFYRVDKGRSRKRGGAGLGLAIVRRIVELHGGAVSAESEVGVGTTIVITLPANVM